MPKIFKVMKGEPVDLAYLRYPIYVSPKLNGIRGYVTDKVMSTANKLIPNTHLQEMFSSVKHRDGEFIVGDPCDTQFSLNRTSSIVMSDDKPIDDLRFYTFDHIEHTNQPFSSRITRLQKDHPNVVVIEHTLIHNEKDLLQAEANYLAEGYEGLITRDPLAAYKFGKSTAKQAWMGKLKRFKDSEAVIIGFEEEMQNTNEAVVSETGRTKRSSAKAGKVGKGTLGSLICRWSNGAVFGVGTGFSDKQRQEIWDIREKYLNGLAKFKYFAAGSDGVPVLPVFLDFRDIRDT